jgi:hypothetical protein
MMSDFIAEQEKTIDDDGLVRRIITNSIHLIKKPK